MSINKALRGLPRHLRLSLTWNRGMEMAEHSRISKAVRMPIYFYPASPWQQGTDENTNEPLRQDLPKGTDLSVQSPVDLPRIREARNSRPRGPLGGRTPTEVFVEPSATTNPLRCNDC